METKLIEIIERGSIPASNLSNIETRLLHSIAFERKEEKKRSQTCVFFSKQEMHHFISIFYFVFFDSKLMPIFNEWLTTNKRICHLPPPPPPLKFKHFSFHLDSAQVYLMSIQLQQILATAGFVTQAQKEIKKSNLSFCCRCCSRFLWLWCGLSFVKKTFFEKISIFWLLWQKKKKFWVSSNLGSVWYWQTQSPE